MGHTECVRVCVMHALCNSWSPDNLLRICVLYVHLYMFAHVCAWVLYYL